jgi:hypothetical protein
MTCSGWATSRRGRVVDDRWRTPGAPAGPGRRSDQVEEPRIEHKPYHEHRENDENLPYAQRHPDSLPNGTSVPRQPTTGQEIPTHMATGEIPPWCMGLASQNLVRRAWGAWNRLIVWRCVGPLCRLRRGRLAARWRGVRGSVARANCSGGSGQPVCHRSAHLPCTIR